MNYVQTRLLLSDLAPGELLEVWIDEGEPAETVPVSLRRDGYRVIEVKPIVSMPGVAITVESK